MKFILLFLPLVWAFVTKFLVFSSKTTNQPKLHDDGTTFREIGRMTDEQLAEHKKTLEAFLGHPSLKIPRGLDLKNKKSNHFKIITDEKGRKAHFNYTLEHSEFHTFYALDPLKVANVSSSHNGKKLKLFFINRKFASKAMLQFEDILNHKHEKIMITGTREWNLRYSDAGLNSDVSACGKP